MVTSASSQNLPVAASLKAYQGPESWRGKMAHHQRGILLFRSFEQLFSGLDGHLRVHIEGERPLRLGELRHVDCHVAQNQRALAAGGDGYTHVTWRVAGSGYRRNLVGKGRFARENLRDAKAFQRPKRLLPELERKRPPERGFLEGVPVSLMKHVSGVGEGGPRLAIFSNEIPASVVWMQMRQENGVDVFRTHPRIIQASQQMPVDTAGVSRDCVRVGFVGADAGIHQDSVTLRAKQISAEVDSPAIGADEYIRVAPLKRCPILFRRFGKYTTQRNGKIHLNIGYRQYLDVPDGESVISYAHSLQPRSQ